MKVVGSKSALRSVKWMRERDGVTAVVHRICRWDFEAAFSRPTLGRPSTLVADEHFLTLNVCVSRFLYRGSALMRSTWMRVDLAELYAPVTVVVVQWGTRVNRVSIPGSQADFPMMCS